MMSRLSVWIVIVMVLGTLPFDAFSRATECPGLHADLNRVDFSHAECRQIDLSDYVMSQPAVWLQFSFSELPVNSTIDSPLGLFISGNLNLDAYLNNQYIGSKGRPSPAAAEASVGPFDWVGFLDGRFLNEINNTLTLFVSSHANMIPGESHFNRFYVGEYDSTTRAYKNHYAVSLVPLGAMLIVLAYVLRHRQLQAASPLSTLPLILLVIAIVQLLLEVSRGFYSYPYPLHLPRLFSIAACALLFGQCMLWYALTGFSKRLKGLLVAACALSALLAQYVTPDYDDKAIVAIQLPAFAGFVLLGMVLTRKYRGFFWFRVTFIAMYLCTLILTLASPADFLDTYFYYVSVISLVLLTNLESDARQPSHAKPTERQPESDKTEHQQVPTAALKEQDTIKIKSAGTVHLIPIRSVMFCKGAGDYVELVCKEKTLLYSGTLAQLQKSLPHGFLKVHRSFLVNTHYIQGIKRNPSGNGELQLTNDERVPVSRALFADIKMAVLAL